MTETSLASATPIPTARAHSAARLPKAGLASTAAAFVIWGLVPLYLAGLTSVSALQIVAHRIVWSCVFVLGWMAARGEFGTLGAIAVRSGLLPRLIASAVFITINWLTFVWAINNDHVVDISLGYYINPLVNVLLGIFVLSERLNRMQWVAVALAAAGVTYITIQTGSLPWPALAVAVSFGLYGLIRKTAHVDALPGLAIELVLLAPFALGYLLWCEMNGTGAFGHSTVTIDTLLVFSGLVTAVPLTLFAYGARRIPYSTVGILQYIGPSLQLAGAVLFFGEPFQRARAIGFAFIWIALLVYASDGLWRARRLRAAIT